MSEKTGPKLKTIDWDKFSKLCALQCTLAEIAGFFDMTPETVKKRLTEEFDCKFSDYFELHSAKGRVSLRRRQFKKAIEEGDTRMLTWLGKNWLGQSDKKEVNQTGNVTFVIDKGDDDIC